MTKKSGKFDKIIIASLALAVFMIWRFRDQLHYVTSLFISEIILLIPFVAVALILSATIEATNCAYAINNIYKKNTALTIILASILGTFIPFCSCTTFPIILTLIISGVSIAPVMAFLLAAPIMDVQMAALSYGTLGWKITSFLWVSAIIIGWIGGFLFFLFEKNHFSPALKENLITKKSCCSKQKEKEKIIWLFWKDNERIKRFTQSLRSRSFFIGKWVVFASLLNMLLILSQLETYITPFIGKVGMWSLPLAALTAIPTYTNGYAATLIASTFLHHGVPPGTIITYMLAGAMSCLPTFTLFMSSFKGRIIASYYATSITGALLAGAIATFTIHT